MMSRTERIIGKVAQVTSDRELIINRGSEHGVKRDMFFKVKDEEVVIQDPDTGDELGTVSPVKVVVRVDEVAPKFSIARTFREHRIKVQEAVEGGAAYHALQQGTSLRGMFQPPVPEKWETRVETLRLDPRKGEHLPESESVVSRGDVVESVLPSESVDHITTTLFK